MNCPRCRLENPETARFCADCGAPLRETGDAPAQTMTLETPREELATGSTFAGRYQIIEELGRGGMGHVYKVFDREIHAKIALKLIKPEVAADRNTIERFRNELKMARDISHKHICRMYDLGREGPLYYITMEYVSGEDLKAMIRMSGRLGIGTAVTVARQLCEGLAEAHSRGIVHRDLKPSNIMIDRDGQVRILDFGIARSIRSKGITGAGVVIGTPEYMSPEQVEGADVDARSDLYSLGIILYECLAGRVPFEGDTPFSVGIKQRSEKPGDPRGLNPDIPEDLDRLILKCLEKDPRRRHQSAAELGAELERIAKRIPTTERILPRRKPSTARSLSLPFALKKAAVPAALVAVAALAAAGWFFLLKKGGPASPSHRHSVAVLTFENQTGDKSYDYLGKAIPNLLITSLEQSPDLSVVTWERMRDLLKQMGRDESETIDADLGFEICRKEGVGTIVLGSFVKAGEMFATDVKVLDVATKRLLKSGGSKGDGLRSILDRQIGELSREISKGVGLSDRAFPSGGIAIAEKTTSSMEAYNLFLKGREEYEKFYYDDARKSLGRAVELDPEFAVAYLVLARVNGALNDLQSMNAAYERAMASSAKATEKDRLYIQAAYAGAVEMDQKKRLELLRRLIEAYPKEKDAYYELATFLRNQGKLKEAIAEYDKALALDPNYGYALNQIAYSYADLGDYGKAIASFERYATLYPKDANPLDSMAEIYFRMGDLDRSTAAYGKAVSIKPDFYASYAGLAYVSALREDYPAALGWMDQYIAKAPSLGLKATGYYFRAFILYWTGQYGRAQAELRKQGDMALSSGSPGGTVGVDLGMSWIAEARGQFAQGRKLVKSWLDSGTKAPGKGSPGGRALYLYFLGMLDIKAGDLAAARSEIKELDALLPKAETHDEEPPGKVQLTYVQEHLRGELLLAEGAADKAAAVLQKLPPIGKPPTMPAILPFYSVPFLKDGLARAYLAQGALDKAVAEYVRLITFDPGKDDRSLINPLYHYRLGKLYERQGLTAKALEQYRKFLIIWKDADPGLPDHLDAKKRIAGLEKH